jgi:hypothetical protein
MSHIMGRKHKTTTTTRGAAEHPCAVRSCDLGALEHPICPTHLQQLAENVALLPARIRDLEITITGQDRLDPASRGARSRETGLPFDTAAAEDMRTVRLVLAGWIGSLHRPGDTSPLPTAYEYARWLRHALPRALATHPRLEDLVADITRLTQLIDRRTDRPPPVIYAGRCGHRRPDHPPCEIALYAPLGSATVICPVCRARHDVNRRREMMRRHIDGMLLTIDEIVNFATYFEQIERRRAQKLLHAWRKRGRIEPSTTAHGRDLYPFGHILEQLLTAERRPPRRRRVA